MPSTCSPLDFSPKVIYREKGADRTVIVRNPTDFPDTTDAGSKVKEVQEPVVKASIIVPEGVVFFRLDGSPRLIDIQSTWGR